MSRVEVFVAGLFSCDSPKIVALVVLFPGLQGNDQGKADPELQVIL